jgi:hypothetical protein
VSRRGNSHPEKYNSAGLGLLFTPAFYTVVRKIGRKKPQARPNEAAPATYIDASRDDHASGLRRPSRAAI